MDTGVNNRGWGQGMKSLLLIFGVDHFFLFLSSYPTW